MQEHSAFQMFPKRNLNRVIGFDNKQYFKKKKFISNYFQITIEPKFQKLYLYHIDIQLPADSNHLHYKIVQNSSKILRTKIGMVAFKNVNIWGTINKNIPQHVSSFYYLQDGSKQNIQYYVKPTDSQVLISDFFKKPQQAKKAIQFMNICIKQKLKQNNLLQLAKRKYFNSEDMLKNRIDNLQNRQDHLSVWKGYKICISNINCLPQIQIDVSSRVLRLHNFQQILSNCQSKAQKKQYIGQTVITRYGKAKTYVIEDIDFGKSPGYEIYYKKTGQNITIKEYFKQAYGVQVHNNTQPLLKVIGKINKQIRNMKVKEPEVNYVYLVPELVSLTGISNQQKKDRQLMKQIAKFTKISPKQRFQQLKQQTKILNKTKLNDLNIFSIGNQVQVNGFIIPTPQITIGKNRRIEKKQGFITFKEPIKQPYIFNCDDFVIVHSGRQKQQDESDKIADDFARNLKDAGETFGIQVTDNCFIKVAVKQGHPKAQDFIQKIKEDIEKNKPMKMLLILLQKKQQAYYNLLKDFCLAQNRILSQTVKISNARSKNILSLASNIVLQMNAKVGNILWQVDSSCKYLKQNTVAIASLMFMKGKSKKLPTAIGFVGSLNNAFSSYHSQNRYSFDSDTYNLTNTYRQYTELLYNWLKEYYRKNYKKLPSTILVYRQGMQDLQKKQRLPNELKGFNQCLEKINKKISEEMKFKQKYDPEIIYITVDKRINTKLFSQQNNSINNLCPGSVVFEELSSNQDIDFHLVPHSVSHQMGTAKPTRYTISAARNLKMPIQQIAILTYQQCYNYYNYRGSVRVPAVMMYASKLASMIGQSIKKKVDKSGLWFL